MSVRNALLALVAQQPAGVYRLKQMFEEQTCGAWPLNIGQVYQTMQRLERDGQVVSHAETNAGRDSEVFELTDAGRDVLNAWWSTPVPREHPERDELVMKLAVAAADPTVDVEAMIQTQRRSTLGSLRDVTRLKASADEGEEGTVRIAVHISPEGKIVSATVLSDSQMENRPIRLEKAARKAALLGIYLPAIRDGKPVDTRLLLPFKFILPQDKPSESAASAE